jgi:hypothetical protein
MPGAMARPKKKPDRDRHAEPKVLFHLPHDLREALVAYVRSVEPATTMSAVARLAIQQYLTRQGVWPPEGEKGGRQ